jgi:hypothetical protein
MCAVRPAKAAGAKPRDPTVGGEAGESPVYAERAKRVERGTPRQRPGPRGAGRDTSLVDDDVLLPPFKQLTRTR